MPIQNQLPNNSPLGATNSTVGFSPSSTSSPAFSNPQPSVAQKPQAANSQPPRKPSPLRAIVMFVLFLAAIVGVVAGVFWFRSRSSSTSQQPTPASERKTITYWGLWENESVLEELFSEFEADNPEYQVEYVKQSHIEYRTRLQADLADDKGPDVFRFHASWTPMLKKELSPLPERIMTQQEFDEAFYPSARDQLSADGKYYGIPLMYDGLGLYYNTDIFDVANESVPTTWDEVKEVAQKLTLRSGDKITRGGIAMGTISNTEHFGDIIGLLMLQNSARLDKPNSPQAIDALSFYLDFSENLGVYDETMPNATTAFAQGNLAMMLAPSWRAHEIKAQNPNLNFQIARVPQLPGQDRIAWASFWAEGVSEKSADKEAAWKLAEFLSSEGAQRKFFTSAQEGRAFGEIYSRVSMASEKADDKYIGAYLEDAPFAQSWYLNSYTHDQGVNDRIIKLYQDALADGSRSLSSQASTLEQGIAQVLSQYGIGASQ